jgi:hypothetical protein
MHGIDGGVDDMVVVSMKEHDVSGVCEFVTNFYDMSGFVLCRSLIKIGLTTWTNEWII